MSTIFDVEPCPGQCKNTVHLDRMVCAECWAILPPKFRTPLSEAMVRSSYRNPSKDPLLKSQVDEALFMIRYSNKTYIYSKTVKKEGEANGIVDNV